MSSSRNADKYGEERIIAEDALDRATLTGPIPPPLGRMVARIMVSVSPDHDGIESLFFRVVLKDDPAIMVPSKRLGDRTSRIASELRARAQKAASRVRVRHLRG